MKAKQSIQNQKGIATVETVLLLFLFVLFMGFATGFYGVIHSGILSSISARAYTFEIFRNRSNLTYHRNPSNGVPDTMANFGFRIHGIVKSNSNDEWKPQQVPISIVPEDREIANSNLRAERATEGVPMRSKADPVWIKTVYGICLDAKCGR